MSVTCIILSKEVFALNYSDFSLLFGNQISYTSVLYYLFLFSAVLVYYLIPKKHRWMLLLLDSVLFYYLLFCGRKCMALLALTIFVSWLWGILLKKSEPLSKKIRKLLLVGGVAACACPLILMDISKMTASIMRREIFENIVIPVGLSFYTLQIIAYLIDIYRGRINPQKNIFKYALFVSFFPQIIQGPISRYEDLSNQLIEGSVFNPNNIQRGFQLILWGFFLKYMIADKAGIIVNTIYGNLDAYSGIYFFVAGTLYTLQLYTDFLSCTTLSRGAALLFGIKLVDNFNQPFSPVRFVTFGNDGISLCPVGCETMYTFRLAETVKE